jgi:hypothetical protein
MNHIVLLGDSIFDNGVYVPGKPLVIDQVRARIADADSATLLAIDGHVTSDVANQLTGLPDDTTHLFISVGGNDALQVSHVLNSDGNSVERELTQAYEGFRTNYRAMLDKVSSCNKPTTLCTIYDYVVVRDISGVKEVVVPVYSVKSVEKMRTKLD